MPGADPREQVSLSVQDRAQEGFAVEAPFVFFIANLADNSPAWPSQQRDRFLDEFWRTEDVLAGAVYSMCAKVAALDYKLEGPSKAVARYNDILQCSDLGGGWLKLLFKVTQDMLTQDNGGFLELLRRPGKSPQSAVDGVAHLDSQRCVQTGDPLQPVNYVNAKGIIHEMGWQDVMIMTDMPTAREKKKGYGFCAVSRVLRGAQILRDIGVYKRQKLSGKRTPGLLFVKGMRRGAIQAAIERSQEEEIQSRGRTVYTGPVVLAANDPGTELDAKLIDLAGLPDGYDEDTLFKWYITSLALAFGTDYSEFAPLPGGNLGTASQVESMAAKSRGKGPGVILQQYEYAFNYYILPRTLTFQFTSTDPEAERERIAQSHERAKERALRVNSGEITARQALLLAIAEEDAPDSFLAEFDAAAAAALAAEDSEEGPPNSVDDEEEDERIVGIARGVRDLNEATLKVQKLIEKKYGA